MIFFGRKNIKENIVTPFQKYELLIKARNFHYESYNKWMTYFYVMTIALFATYYNLFRTANDENTHSDIADEIRLFMLGIVIFGVIISILWHLANKGYYYWYLNFIKLINHYEENILNFNKDERIYFVMANKEENDYPLCPFLGANFSTSKISIFISYLFSYVWCLILNYTIIKTLSSNCLGYYILGLFSPIIYIMLLTIIFSWKFKSEITDFPDLQIKICDNN